MVWAPLQGWPELNYQHYQHWAFCVQSTTLDVAGITYTETHNVGAAVAMQLLGKFRKPEFC